MLVPIKRALSCVRVTAAIVILLCLFTGPVSAQFEEFAGNGKWIVEDITISGQVFDAPYFESYAMGGRAGSKYFDLFLCYDYDHPKYDGTCGADRMGEYFWRPWLGISFTVDFEFPYMGVDVEELTPGKTVTIFAEIAVGDDDPASQYAGLHVYGVCPVGDQACLRAAGAFSENPGDDGKKPGDDQCKDHDGNWPGKVGTEVEFSGVLDAAPSQLEAYGAATIAIDNAIVNDEPGSLIAYYCKPGQDCYRELEPPFQSLYKCLDLGESFELGEDESALRPGVEVEGTGLVVTDSGGNVVEVVITSLAITDFGGSSCSEEEQAMQLAQKAYEDSAKAHAAAAEASDQEQKAAQKAYDEARRAAQVAYNEAINKARNAYYDALDTSQADYNQSVAEAQRAYKESAAAHSAAQSAAEQAEIEYGSCMS